MKIELILKLTAFILLAFSCSVTWAEPDIKSRAPLKLDFDEVKLGGFERIKLGNDLKVRGWRIGKTYIGQTRVADHWGLGFVVTHGDTVYGVNHRGFQFLRRF